MTHVTYISPGLAAFADPRLRACRANLALVLPSNRQRGLSPPRTPFCHDANRAVNSATLTGTC